MQLKTPEERIMDLIDNPSMKKRARKEAVSTMFGLGDVLSLLRAQWSRLSSLWALRHINRALAAVCALATVLFAFQLRASDISYDRRIKELLRSGDDIRSSLAAMPSMDVTRAELLSSRAVFGGGSGAAAEQPQAERLKKILLVGVLTENGTRCAVLEDGETKTTAIVAPGDRYGEYRVDAVADDAVTFSGSQGTWVLK